MYDLIIVGAGPGGMSAALYAQRAGLRSLVLESSMYGGQMVTTPEVENYPALRAVSGFDLAQNMYDQMMALGAEFQFCSVLSAQKTEDGFSVETDGASYVGKALILANGAKRKKLACPGEEAFAGRGVSYCATCDGAFFRKKTACVVGGGNTALEDALYLASLCQKVYLIHRRDTFRGEEHLVKQIQNTPAIEIIYNAVPTEIIGSDKVEKLCVQNTQTQTIRTIDTDAVFVAIGLSPDNARFADLIDLDARGYIKAGENCETSLGGVWAVGDTRTKTLRQIITAASDGAIAGAAAAQYVKTLGK